MNYLLDTHTFIWSLFESDRLSEKSTNIILNSENNIYVSVITFWEISLKYNLGKLSLQNVTPEELPGYAESSGFNLLNLEAPLAASFYNLPKKSHKDPFDRLLIWQCIQDGITLITKDSQILKEYKQFHLKTVW